jgi:hypothetical protein
LRTSNHRGLEPGSNRCKTKKNGSSEYFLEPFSLENYDQTMVHEIDATWNHIYGSILVMYQKLRDLGFIYYEGQIVIVERRPE